jgi:hypothetical protein
VASPELLQLVVDRCGAVAEAAAGGVEVAALLAAKWEQQEDGIDVLRCTNSSQGGELQHCCNPCCTNLACDSEAQLPLPHTCPQCGVAQYCSPQCREQAAAVHCRRACGELAAPPPPVASRCVQQ